MKFKYLVIFLGIIIVFFLSTIILLSLLSFGPEFVDYFHKIIQPVSIVLIVILIIVFVFFISRYRLFSLLEREDWPALAFYLEHEIYVKNRYNSQKIGLLASSYLVISDYAAVLDLENKALIAKPASVKENILIFGASRVLGGNYREAADFFKTYLTNGVKEEQWVRWFYGFSLMLFGAFSKAEPEFIGLAKSSNNVIVTGLSSYFLYNNLSRNSLKPAECNAAAETGRERVVKILKNEKNWKRETAKGTKVHTTIIKKYINEAGSWLFNQQQEQ